MIASSVEDAVAAAEGGADRLEVVRELDRGGLTPAPALVRAVQEATRLPLRVMLRDRDDYESGGDTAVRRLAETAAALAALGVDGLVAGFLRGSAIDAGAMHAIAAAAPGVRVTFHHAFDSLSDARAALDAVAKWPQVDRILTAGGAGAWTDRAERLAALGTHTERILLVGGGVTADALRILAATPGIREAHVGRAARAGAEVRGAVQARRVAALVEACRRTSEHDRKHE